MAGNTYIDIAYNREKAVAYAHKWAFGRNPRYYNFADVGGDCTNFVSQCIYAGCGVMNYRPLYGWYYNNSRDRTPSWSGVKYLYNFLTKNSGVGPWATECTLEQLQPGDVVQLRFDLPEYTHSLLVVAAQQPQTTGEVLIATHSYDSDNRELDSYTYNDVRYLHIEGARNWG